MAIPKPVVLCILDGWGLNPDRTGNAVAQARTPHFDRVMAEFPSFEFPIWLVTHRELQTSRRIRIVFDLLARGLAEAGRGAPPT